MRFVDMLLDGCMSDTRLLDDDRCRIMARLDSVTDSIAYIIRDTP